MKTVITAFIAATVVGCSTLPSEMYRSPAQVHTASNFELCRAAFDPSATDTDKRFVAREVESRNLGRDSCFDILLAEHGSNTMCSRYQYAIARGEPSALVGFATNISVQEIERGFERHGLRCQHRAVDTRSGLEVLSEQMDQFNERSNERRRNTVDCYEVYPGRVRCR